MNPRVADDAVALADREALSQMHAGGLVFVPGEVQRAEIVQAKCLVRAVPQLLVLHQRLQRQSQGFVIVS